MSHIPKRAPVSQRRFLARRVGAGLVLLVVAFVAAKGVMSVVDTTPTSAESPPDASVVTATTEQPVGSVTDTAVSATTVPATTSSEATTTTRPERTGPPSQSEPAQVLIVGDSGAGTFGPYLEQLLDATEIVDTELDYKVSSGLARPDFFDWPIALAESVPVADPDIVVVTFGGNDAQGLSEPGDEANFIIGDPVDNEAKWTKEYERRAGGVMDLLLEDDRAVIWVGIPNHANPKVTARMAVQDRAAKAAAADRPDVVFIDTWARFSGRDGNWAEFVIDPRDGEGKDVRSDDGFHLNVAGAEILAIDIAQAVRDELLAMGADI